MMELPSDYLEQVKLVYPKRLGEQGWEKVRTLIPHLFHTWKDDWDSLLRGARNYAEVCKRTNKLGTEFVMRAAVFYDAKQRLFAEYAEMDLRTPQEIAIEGRWYTARAMASRMNFREPFKGEVLEAYESALRTAQQKTQTMGAPHPSLRIIG